MAANATKFQLRLQDRTAPPAAPRIYEPQTLDILIMKCSYSINSRTTSRFLYSSTPKPGQVLQLLRTKRASPPITPCPHSLRRDAFRSSGCVLPCSCFLCFSLYPVQFLLHSHRRCYVILRRLRSSQCSVHTCKGLDYPTWRCKRDAFCSDTGCGGSSSSLKPSRAISSAETFSSPRSFMSSTGTLFDGILRGELCRALPLL